MSASPNYAAPATNHEPIVAFDAIGKSFFGVKVLQGVTFSVGSERIVGLVGENGAGKSTLMNLLGGNLQPDAGRLRVQGRPYAPQNPNDARAAGIAFVHQELNLFPNLSIAENLHLTTFPLVGQGSRLAFPWIDRAALRTRTADLLHQVGLDEAPETLVERLPAGERQLVEIAQALGADARLIILDEPTTSLSARECDRLFALINQLRGRGIALIYISHALGDVLRLCDELVVLRDGEMVGGGPTPEFTHDRLVSLMVGRKLNQLYPERTRGRRREESQDTTEARGEANERSGDGSSPGLATAPGTSCPHPARPKHEASIAPWEQNLPRPPATEALLEVRSLTQPGIIRDISFDLAAGEVLGLSGLMGAGRSELARILFGLDPCASGGIRLAGQLLSGPPRRRIQRGLAFLTENRHHEGLCLEASISDNMVLAALPALSHALARWIDFDAIKKAVSRMREAVRLSPKATHEQAVRTLSGGNQQKVVLGKWLLAEPRVLILDEPTRGIDVGAKFEIYQLICQLADRGTGVLLISSEIEELIGICDRLLVMRHGEIAAEFQHAEFDRERILAAALPPTKA